MSSFFIVLIFFENKIFFMDFHYRKILISRHPVFTVENFIRNFWILRSSFCTLHSALRQNIANFFL